MISKKHFLVISLLLLCKLSVVEAARDDVLVIVNDNSLDSPQIGAYYAQQRDINPANIVHIKVPDSYFISWSDFRRLRDQLIRFMQLNTLDDPALTPAICTDGEPPYYCNASMDQLRAHTTIRYLVTTRGVPTRMTVDGSTLRFPSAPTSVDNYLKYWLINYFTDDVQLMFTQRELAFADGSGMRTVQPATDRELIIGRIDGLDQNAARALVDRAIAVENAGIFGTWYGSTQFWRWRDENTGQVIYPRSGNSLQGWRYGLGMWREDRAECADYLNFSGFLAEGKAPAHCRLQFNDDSDSDLQFTQGINYPAPGNSQSREPLVIDALGYQGWLDGQATLGSFDALLNWRKNDQCTVTLCDNAADPASCRANSSDIFGELNTDCVGVADGFMGYNHQSWPMSYLAIWPTGWFQSNVIGSKGWNDTGGGDLNQLAFPEVSSDDGFDDSNSLWFRNTDQVANPLCYASSDFTLALDQPCMETRRVVLSQKITLATQTLDINSPQTYRFALRYKTLNIANNVDLRVRLFIHETGAGDALIDYGVQTLALLTPVDTTGWTAAEVVFTLDPLLHSVSSYDGIKITIDTPNAFAGDLGIDVVSVQETTAGLELANNGSFSLGHRQTATGDHAATFLNRLGGVAAWGSVGHHQSSGCAFCFNGLESMIYFLRGLPLGDAVWFNESNNSGLLYGDPLYSPVAVRLNPVNSADFLGSSTLRTPIDLIGSTVNGRDPAQVDTSYRIDICPGNDFYACDQARSWSPTGISGLGGSENMFLGTLDTTLLTTGQYTLRLQVTSLNITNGRSQTINDFYVASVNDLPVAIDGNLKTLINVTGSGFLTSSVVDNGTLSYSIVSNASKGIVGIINATTGAYQYRPNPGITGVDSFTFKVNDGIIDSNIATVSINIALTNDAPVALDAVLNANENVVASGTLSASDLDNDSLTYSLVNNASKGIVTITDSATGAYSYTPNANASGADSFTFKVNDGMVDSNIATVTVNITAMNNPPVAVDANLNTDEDVVANGNLNATDVDGDALTYSIVSNGAKGTATITNATTGAYSYMPNANATGSDSFSFKVNDGLLDSNIAIVSVNIIAVNDAPIAQAKTLNTTEDVATNSVLSASDADGDSLSYSLVSNGVKGTVVITNASTGAYSYTPNANANGADSFTFKVNDGLADSNIATVNININAVNDAPIASVGALSVTEDVIANGNLNASDVDGNVLTYSIVNNSSKGFVTITDISTGAYIYTSNANAIGVDSFTFKANDGLLDSNFATVNVNITAVNDAPIAQTSILNTSEDVLANGILSASDIDGDSLSYILVRNAVKGTVVITNTNTGAYNYTPNANATGADSFTFKVNDGQQGSNIATVSINISAANDAPLASAGTLTTNEDTAASGSLKASDIDGDALTFSLVANTAKGTVVITNAITGTYTYTPNANATGSDSFSVKANDGQTDSNIASISVSITAVNDTPVATSASISTFSNEPVSGTLSAVDADGEMLIFSLASNASQGTVVITNTSTGNYTYTPNPDVTGTDSFTYVVSDGQVNSNIAKVAIQLQEVNVANNDSAASGGSLNLLFVLLLSLLSGLRFIPVGRV